MWKSGMKWMFLIIGTMVGAGYASGRELWQFFGHESGLAIILFTILFICAVAITMKVSYANQTKNYYNLLEILLGTKIARFYDVLIFFYLMSTTVIMIAGSGATFEAFFLSKWIGIFFIILFIILIFMKGINGVLTFNVAVLPLLMVGLLSILVIYSLDEKLTFMIKLDHQDNWMAAFTFTALNILSILAVLGAVGDQIKSNGEIIIASIGSGLILGFTSYLYNNSLIQISEIIILYEIPLFAILKNYPDYTYIIMTVLLWFAIFTTAVSSVLGIVTRLARFIKYNMWQIACVLLFILTPLTKIGFSTLIALLYPIYGIVNLYLLCAILLFPFYKKI
ncbi:hypothetical protein JCM21714_2961 [Gracilibacillus boraciitolerans JCM 21714]|uniref:Membrane protein YkvI n=1 Tax=Gracilibacillus boraciitolerans JCM 21714 TaxID=1298598 RepID=W4VL12_9BACI|nr:membrane protein [Gracilibacillus boraciitolerans]GAE93851.1 hypothetical protein JCM21714_2961 [Gracilibacillus boraciitolerans JCM 21714]